MTAKHPKTAPAPLRDQITAYLSRKAEATAKDIAQHTSEAAYPSRVLNELNRMRTDALVECEKRKGKGNEHYYWLTNAVQTGAKTQPEVGDNTGKKIDCQGNADDALLSDGTEIEPGDDLTTRAVKLAVRNHNKLASLEAASPARPDFARDPELQYLAPEDYELPPADPALLASANRMLCDRLEGVAHVLRGCGLPALTEVTGHGDLQPHVAALSGAYQMLIGEHDTLKERHTSFEHAVDEIHRHCHDAGIASGLVHERVALLAEQHAAASEEIGTIHDLLAAGLPDSDPRDPSDIPSIELAQNIADELLNARALATKLQTLLDSATHEREALRTEIERLRKEGADAVDVIDAATAYLVRAPKRKPRILTKPEAARNAAMACARNGSGRGEVFALVHVGTAKRCAEWTEPDRNSR